MKTSFLRIILVALVALFGVSFLNVSFPVPSLFPVLLFAIAVSLSLSEGFVRALLPIITIGLVADIASLGKVGLLAAFCVGLAYTVSFFSRRFAVEHGIMMHVFAGIVVGFGAVVFLIVSAWFYGTSVSGMADPFFRSYIPTALVAGVVTVPIVSVLMRRLNGWLSYFESPHAF